MNILKDFSAIAAWNAGLDLEKLELLAKREKFNHPCTRRVFVISSGKGQDGMIEDDRHRVYLRSKDGIRCVNGKTKKAKRNLKVKK